MAFPFTNQQLPSHALINWIQNGPGIPPSVLQKPTISRRKFSHEEDEKLRTLVQTYGESDWHNLASQMEGRNARQCRERWKHYLSPKVSTGPWTEAEDQLLNEKYNEYGSQWARISKFFLHRTDITVKNRWISLHGKSKKEQMLQQQQMQMQQQEEPQEANIEAPMQEEESPTLQMKEDKNVEQIENDDLKITETQND